MCKDERGETPRTKTQKKGRSHDSFIGIGCMRDVAGSRLDRRCLSYQQKGFILRLWLYIVEGEESPTAAQHHQRLRGDLLRASKEIGIDIA